MAAFYKKVESLFPRILKRLFRSNYGIQRFFLYSNPRRYWENRGGERYFTEQEVKKDREDRSIFIAKEIAALSPESVCEIGCGYGKQLKNISKLCKDTRITGVDFSKIQLKKAREFVGKEIELLCADAKWLPFADKSFDLVFTSAVILHNPPEDADMIRKEIIRIARRYIVHNEDIDVTLTRYGYNNTEIYKGMGLKVVKSCPIPVAPNPSITQFTSVELGEDEQ